MPSSISIVVLEWNESSSDIQKSVWFLLSLNSPTLFNKFLRGQSEISWNQIFFKLNAKELPFYEFVIMLAIVWCVLIDNYQYRIFKDRITKTRIKDRNPLEGSASIKWQIIRSLLRGLLFLLTNPFKGIESEELTPHLTNKSYDYSWSSAIQCCNLNRNKLIIKIWL